jgi:anti-anti-sigma factor
MQQVTHDCGVTVIHLGPNYDSFNEELLGEVQSLLLEQAYTAEPPWLVLDFTATTYVCSPFLESIVRCWKRLKQRDGRMALAGASGIVADVFHAVHFDRIWRVFQTPGEAVAELVAGNHEPHEG